MLKGKRVVLRAVEREDLERFTEFSNDLELHELSGWTAWVPESLAQKEARFDKKLAEDDDDVVFAIEVEGVLIGDCQLVQFSDDHRHCMLGITIGDKGYWGQGYGEEAIELLLDYAFDHLNMHRVQLGVYETNERAQRLYKKLGFIEEGRDRELVYKNGRYIDNIRMGILRDEWKTAKR